MTDDKPEPTKDDKPSDEKKPKAPKEKDQRKSCMFLPGSGARPSEALIHERSRADINVAELELRDGRRVQSVPRWNEKGERPSFDVWTED